MSELFPETRSSWRISSVYGNAYTFNLDPRPGVTLIVGPNRFRPKTTFFDGIEWALTGRVSRFDDVPRMRRERDPLSRG